jgi:hypothetical protein
VIRRVCGRLWRIALAIVIVLLLSLVVFIWRLAKAPIPLKLLTPYIETVLPPSLTGLQIDVQNVFLAWHRRAKRMVLSARDVHLRDPQGVVDATLPTVDVTLRLRALWRQRVVALNHVYIDGAQFHLRTAEPDAHPRLILPTPPSVFKALETLIAAMKRRALFADLHTVRVVNSTVTLSHASLTRPLHLSALVLSLGQTTVNVNSEWRLPTSPSEPDITFTLGAFYERAAPQLSLKSQFVHLRPSVLAALDPTLSRLSGISIPLTGSLHAVLKPQDTWPVADFDIQGGPGQITLVGLYHKPRQIKGLTASGHLDGANETLRIETATCDLGASKHSKPRLHLQSTITGLSHSTRVEGDVTLTAFTMADLERYWPPGAGQAPRRWITQNIPEGLIHQTKAHVVLGTPKADQKGLVVQDITGSLQYEGLEVHYLRPLPPIQQVTGKGQFDRSGFHFQVANGALATMALTGGTVDITGLDRPKQAITIRAGITGPLQEALTLLNHPRLHLMTGLGMPLATATGRLHAEPKITFALKKPLRMKDIDINAQGILQDLSLQKVVLGQDLSNGQLHFDLDKHRMTVAGRAEWATIPLSFTWQTLFKPPSTQGWRDQMHVVIPRVGHAGRARLGYDLPGIIEGPMAAVIDTQSGWDKQRTVDLQLDLRETTLNLPWLHWHKPAGEPAQAAGKLQLIANRVMSLTDLHLDTNTLKARGRAQFNGATIVRADFPHVTFGTSDFRDMVFQRLKPGLAITVGDSFLDAAPLRQLLVHPSKAPNTDGSRSTVTFPVQLHLPRLHRVQMAPARFLRNVRAHLAWNGVGWDAITVSGRLPAELTRQRNGKPPDSDNDTKTFDFRYLSTTQHQPNLSLQTNDIGAVLRALNIYDNLIGGDLDITGHTNPNGAGIQAELQATQFTVQQAPIIAQLLAAASLHGLANLLSNDGLKFDDLNAEVTLYGDRLTITQGHAHGGSLGVTAHGDIAYRTGDLDLQGTIIPAYLLNSILGQVPVVNLLVGGKGQGLVAVNYQLTGELAKPHVSVNPISALTPGFLRGIFGLFPSNTEGDTQPSPPELTPEQETQIHEP